MNQLPSEAQLQQPQTNHINHTVATTTMTNSTAGAPGHLLTQFQCEDCSQLIPTAELVHHIRSHWQTRVDQLEQQLRVATRGDDSQPSVKSEPMNTNQHAFPPGFQTMDDVESSTTTAEQTQSHLQPTQVNQSTSIAPPKRPLTPYILFSNAKRAQIKAENPGIGIGATAQKIADLWKSATVDPLESYHRAAAEARARWEKEMADYKTHQSIGDSQQPSMSSPLPSSAAVGVIRRIEPSNDEDALVNPTAATDLVVVQNVDMVSEEQKNPEPEEEEAKDDGDEVAVVAHHRMSLTEIQTEFDHYDGSRNPCDAESWEERHHWLIAEEEDMSGKDESVELEMLMELAAHPIQASRSHVTSVPVEVIYENEPDEIEELKELLNNPDADETALDEVIHQLDHVPESIRLLLEELLEQHNAEDHPLKYCSVEEFHSMVDSHLHPSGGGEFEYVGKLVQQLESALKSSQHELAKYMKTKELNFNDMGAYLIEQKRIKEELIKQRAILFPLESPLWQSCMKYLKKLRQCLDRDPVSMIPVDKFGSRLPIASSNLIAAASTEESKSDPAPTSTTIQPGLDTAVPMDESTAVELNQKDDNPSLVLESDDAIDHEEEDGMVEELLDELDEDRYGQYQWLMESLDEYERVRALGPHRPAALIWSEVQTFLQTTAFIGHEVKDKIQFLLTHGDPFLIDPSHDVGEWAGWATVDLKSDDYSPLDSALPLNRKLLRALDALMDTIMELMDEHLDERDQRSQEHHAVMDSTRLLYEVTESHDSLPPLPEREPRIALFLKRLEALEKRLEQAARAFDNPFKPGVLALANVTPDSSVTSTMEEETHRVTDHRRKLVYLYEEAKNVLPLLTSEHILAIHQQFSRNIVRFEQYQTETIIPRRSMELLIREVLQEVENTPMPSCLCLGQDIDFTPEAIEAIHVAAEDHLIKQFDLAGTEMESMNRIIPLVCSSCHRATFYTDSKYVCEECPEFYLCYKCHSNWTASIQPSTSSTPIPPSIPSSVASTSSTFTVGDPSSPSNSAENVNLVTPLHPTSHSFRPVYQYSDEIPSETQPLTTFNRAKRQRLNANYQWAHISQVGSIGDGDQFNGST